MEQQGYIHLHRTMMDSPFYNDSACVHLWVHILISANHKDNIIKLGGSNYTVKKGSFITSILKISEATGISPSKTSRLLQYLKSEKQISLNSTTKYTEIVVVNWDKYQCFESGEKQMENKWKTNEKQMVTNNNEDNKKKIYIPDQAIACLGNAPIPQVENELKKTSKERKNLEVDEKFKSFIEKTFNPIRMKAGKGLKPVGLNSKKAKKQFAELIKTYTGKDFVTVMQNAVTDKYHLENNFYYLTPEFITREDKFTRFLNMSQVKIPTSQIPAEYGRQRTREEVDNMFG